MISPVRGQSRKYEPVYIPIVKQIWRPRSCLLSFFTSNEGSNQSFLVFKALGLYIFYRKQKCYGLNWENVCEIQLGKGRVTASENARLHPVIMSQTLRCDFQISNLFPWTINKKGFDINLCWLKFTTEKWKKLSSQDCSSIVELTHRHDAWPTNI